MAHIVVVENDAAFRQMLVDLLKQDGYQVTSAGDGVEAIKLLARVQADVIITDILMPNMDGIELMMELSRQDNHTPVIAMSGGRRSPSRSRHRRARLYFSVSGRPTPSTTAK